MQPTSCSLFLFCLRPHFSSIDVVAGVGPAGRIVRNQKSTSKVEVEVERKGIAVVAA